LFGLIKICISFFMLISLVTTVANAVPMGAAVSWVPYDNRSDFPQDQKLLHQLIQDGPAKNSFFHVPPERHFEVPTTWPFNSRTNRSFLKGLKQQVSNLTGAIKSTQDPSPDPFLVVAIASHGDDGCLSLQYGSPVSLDLLTKKIFEEGKRFFKQTGYKLRLEILYSACGSGSLINAIEANKSVYEKYLGAVSVLTTTTGRRTSWSSLDSGDFLLRQLLTFKDFAAAVAAKKKWHESIPTLAEFGFYKHFGAGEMNHPQSYSDAFDWDASDTVEFLKLQPFVLDDTSGDTRFAQRNLNIADMLNKSESVTEALKIIQYERRNSDGQIAPGKLLAYLKSPSSIVAYAAALFTINTNSPIPRNSQYRRLESRAQAILAKWLQDPQFDQVMGVVADPTQFYFEVLPNIAVNSTTVDNILPFVERLYSRYDKKVARSCIEKLREVLRLKYHLEQNSLLEIENSDAKLLSAIPDQLLLTFVKIYFGINRSANTIEQIIAELPSIGFRYPLSNDIALGICKRILTLESPQERLRELAQFAISRHDRKYSVGF